MEAVKQTGIKEPFNLSKRIEWLRNYYFQGDKRSWNNEFSAFTTGTQWDEVFDETSFLIVPEVYTFFPTFRKSFAVAARKIDPPKGFYSLSIAERRAWFMKEAIVNRVPQEILPGDLIAGGRFNVMASRCWSKAEAAARNKAMFQKEGVRNATFAFQDRGYGNCGATSGHLIPDYPRVLKEGFRGIQADLESKLNALPPSERSGEKGGQLRAMIASCDMPVELAAKYAVLCQTLADDETDVVRRQELLDMRENLLRVPKEPARDFYEAVQSLWLTHMLVLTDENYPGAGVSFGRIDQYLLPYWQGSVKNGMSREFGKEILKCFWMHCNFAYDAMIQTGNQGITAGYGQLFNLSGMGKNGQDMTNDLTWVFLDVIDEMSPILEPKPNVRLHEHSPEELLDRVIDMISTSQGAPFLLNFDERSMAGMLEEAKRAHVEHLINENTVFDYASVGCLENTMCGNDRSATVDCNPNLVKAVELALGNGQDLIVYTDALWGKPYPPETDAPKTGDPRMFVSFEEFYCAFRTQLNYVIERMAALYERSTELRAKYAPTPYLSCLVRGCAEQGKDCTQGGAELSFVTVEGVTFATTVDSLLAIKYLVYDQQICRIETLIQALKANWKGFEILQAQAKNRAPKYGRDDDAADALAARVMSDWSNIVWNYKTKATNAQFRPGMLSWNYWIGSGFILPATADGRARGQFLSNAICPVNGTDTNGPTGNANSVGKALGGRDESGKAINLLPNGASHTITLSPSLIRDKERREKLKAFLRGYIHNGGTALQINILDAETLKDAQQHPENYRNLLVRITGYNAYFTSIGRELQNEIIARESHNRY
ncbi:MAG: pyruvate formate lyase family protein [Eubacteriales bacterium]|nr:pyruvate formate lyase family protein [Eubacteriales bacterium]